MEMGIRVLASVPSEGLGFRAYLGIQRFEMSFDDWHFNFVTFKQHDKPFFL